MDNNISESIDDKVKQLLTDLNKFENGNDTAGTRVRKTAHELKAILHDLRKYVLERRKTK